MELVKLDIPAGVKRGRTELDSKGRWYDANLVRWRNGDPMPIGGWQNFTPVDVDKVSLVTDGGFESLGSEPTTSWFYAEEIVDPVVARATTFTVGQGYEFDIGSSATTVNTSFYTNTASLTLTNSYRVTIDISVDVSVSGVELAVTLNGREHSSIRPSSDRQSYSVDMVFSEGFAVGGLGFTIKSLATNTTTATMTVHSIDARSLTSQSLTPVENGVPRGAHAWLDNGGAPYVAWGTFNSLWVMNGNKVVTDITPTGLTNGLSTSTVNRGYGGGPYGAEAYGTPRTVVGSAPRATNWTLDNWGENLLACSDAGGEIWEYDLSSTSLLTNAPTGNKSIIVTAERFVMALGAGGDPRKVQWSDREDNTTWSPSVINEAGDVPLQTQGQIVCAERVRGRTLILTTQDAFVATYQGPPTVYGFQKVGDACGIVGRNLSASIGTATFWMGKNSFYVYDGSQVRVLPCEVEDYVFSNINRDKITQAFCVSNQDHNEVWWFYAADGSEENNRYVWFDYQENHWGIGEMVRTAGVDSGVWDNPLWFSEGEVYRHEFGLTHQDFGAAVSPAFLESGPINFNEGDRVVRVSQLIPEEGTPGDCTVSFATKLYPNTTEFSHGPYTLNSPTSLRFTGRQVKARIDGAEGQDWRIGDLRLRVRQGGRR